MLKEKIRTGNYAEAATMTWEFFVALVILIPIILFPAAFVWYLNVGGIYLAIKEALERWAARRKGKTVVTEAKQDIAVIGKRK
jgi:hypothetical protein